MRHKAAGGPEAYGGGGGSGSGDDGGIHSCHRPISQDSGMCMAQLVQIQIYLKIFLLINFLINELMN